jgi:hypothetical protein
LRTSNRRVICACLLLASFSPPGVAQTAAGEDEAVGQSINYVFATDLGSGVYEMDGRSLQIYRFTWRRELRAPDEDTAGVRFVLPVTAGFFDFDPVDVISKGPPTRVDSFSVVPGVEYDYLLAGGWHVTPYARGGLSFASNSVGGILYGAGVRLERRAEFHGWDQFLRSELAYAGVEYRHDVPGDHFLRLRHGVDITRPFGRGWRGRRVELGLYAVFDLIADPPTAPVANAREVPIQAEFGFTLASRPRVKIWKFDAPRLGFSYRLAGELSGWRLVIGVPF